MMIYQVGYYRNSKSNESPNVVSSSNNFSRPAIKMHAVPFKYDVSFSFLCK